MEIVKVKLSKVEVDSIFNALIDLFEPYKAKRNPKGHTINFDFSNQLNVCATLNLIVDTMEYNKDDQTLKTDCTVMFSINLYYNGVSVEGLEDTDIEDRIKNYNWIKTMQL